MAALNTFPSTQTSVGIVGGNVQIFLDTKLSQRATVYSASGVPLPGNALVVPSDGYIPVFQCAASLVYVKNAAGEMVTLRPDAQMSAPTVSGSKGANAALTSLMAALVQLGLVVDQTS